MDVNLKAKLKRLKIHFIIFHYFQKIPIHFYSIQMYSVLKKCFFSPPAMDF